MFFGCFFDKVKNRNASDARDGIGMPGFIAPEDQKPKVRQRLGLACLGCLTLEASGWRGPDSRYCNGCKKKGTAARAALNQAAGSAGADDVRERLEDAEAQIDEQRVQMEQQSRELDELRAQLAHLAQRLAMAPAQRLRRLGLAGGVPQRLTVAAAGAAASSAPSGAAKRPLQLLTSTNALAAAAPPAKRAVSTAEQAPATAPLPVGWSARYSQSAEATVYKHHALGLVLRNKPSATNVTGQFAIMSDLMDGLVRGGRSGAEHFEDCLGLPRGHVASVSERQHVFERGVAEARSRMRVG